MHTVYTVHTVQPCSLALYVVRCTLYVVRCTVYVVRTVPPEAERAPLALQMLWDSHLLTEFSAHRCFVAHLKPCVAFVVL